MKDARPASTRSWFWCLTNLTTIDGLANFNTSEVTEMREMFEGCSSLTSLDLSNFNTSNVTSTVAMFYGCTSLTTIYCDEDWSTGSATSDNMFYGCTSLEGGKGTKYDADKIDKTYARLDGMGDKPGYFTAKGTVKKEIYATLSEFTMTLYYDDQKASRSGVLDKWSAADGTYYLPEETCNSITKVIINPSMEDARPTRTRRWFSGMENLTTIDGMANLNTSEVTDMSIMFYGCKKLKSLDLTGFNTAKVQDMNYMFAYCYALTSLDVSSWHSGHLTAPGSRRAD